MSDQLKRIEKSIELDATPEEVWAAVATGEGMACWFVPHRFDPPEGGVGARVVSDFGSGNVSEATVREWEPGRRYSSSADGQTEVVEFLVEGRDGGGAVLRLIHSGITGEDWEAEYHSHGWDGFLANLRRYFDHFRGLPPATVSIIAFSDLDKDGIWARFNDALGIDRQPAVGDTVHLTPDGLDPIDGVVEVAEPGNLGIRSNSGAHFFSGDGAWGMVTVVHYYFGDEFDRDVLTAGWQRWADSLFPPPAAAPPAAPPAG
ncbi:SRPBCC family protein [Dietzia cercidiphylli]|uniref:SRPBCC family protein n=1 Tax=Dietzia cercidiphylli TaxID=498199 RepID=UPI003F808FE9